jgi:hypothetical protein
MSSDSEQVYNPFSASLPKDSLKQEWPSMFRFQILRWNDLFRADLNQ